ncbi:MAG: Uma2 family endonuclease [Isosphaeraceae bacterium]
MTTLAVGATVSPSRPRETASLETGDQRIVIRGVDADLYNRLDAAIGEGQHVRLAYDGKDLEIITTGNVHEVIKARMGAVATALIVRFQVDCLSSGQTTWKTAESDRGLEADQSYYFDPEKIRVARAALARRSLNPADYPVGPDLAVEIDVSRSKVDRPLIYAALRVAEVWRFDGRRVVIEQLQPDGTYAEVEQSRFLHVTAAEVLAWLTADDVLDEAAWTRRLFTWAMALHPPV